jgi:hypothetical protein
LLVRRPPTGRRERVSWLPSRRVSQFRNDLRVLAPEADFQALVLRCEVCDLRKGDLAHQAERVSLVFRIDRSVF